MINVDLKNNKVAIIGDIPVVSTEISFLLSCLYVRAIEEGMNEEVVEDYMITLFKNSMSHAKESLKEE